MSRQRLRPSLLEHSTEICPHCAGTGRIRSIESAALHALRTIEEEGVRRRASEIVVSVPPNVALYLLNQKRHTLSRDREALRLPRHRSRPTTSCMPPIARSSACVSAATTRRPAQELARASYDESDRDDASHTREGADAEGDAEHETFADARSEGQEPSADGEGESAQEGGRRRRRRRRRRSRGDGDGPVDNAVNGDASAEHAHDDRTESEGGEPSESEGDGEFAGEAASEANGSDQGDRSGGDIGTDEHRRRRRGRRGGRRRRREDGEVEGSDPRRKAMPQPARTVRSLHNKMTRLRIMIPRSMRLATATMPHTSATATIRARR